VLRCGRAAGADADAGIPAVVFALPLGITDVVNDLGNVGFALLSCLGCGRRVGWNWRAGETIMINLVLVAEVGSVFLYVDT